jgi:predicted MPP superfamily phosphohydrolase
MQDKIDKGFLTDEQYIRLEKKRDEEYKERVKLQDENRCKRSLLREESRFEKILQYWKESLDNSNEIVLKEYKKKTNDKTKYAILSLSDWHIGKIIDNQFNFYNKETSIERVSELKNKVIKYCKNHKVNKLIMEINGDMIEGQIHISSRVQSEMDSIEQIVFVTDLLVSLINDLKPYFEEIKVYTTIGNHSRLIPNKSETITKESFETMIPIRLRDKLQDVKVISSNGLDFLQYEIEDKVICLAHGQNDNMSSVISDFSKIYKTVPTEVHLGHTHSYKDLNDCDVIVNVNGSMCGTDDYAITLRKVTVPSQNLIIYDDDRCVYELKLN